jgi:hypothetical protein
MISCRTVCQNFIKTEEVSRLENLSSWYCINAAPSTHKTMFLNLHSINGQHRTHYRPPRSWKTGFCVVSVASFVIICVFLLSLHGSLPSIGHDPSLDIPYLRGSTRSKTSAGSIQDVYNDTLGVCFFTSVVLRQVR